MTVVTNPCRAMDDGGEGAASDLTVVAGIGSDTQRFQASRARLAAASPALAALVTALQPHDPLVLDCVDRRAFEQISRHLDDEPVQLPSVSVARALMHAAHRLLLPRLVELAVRRLDELLDGNTVVETLCELRFLCTPVPCGPSAPPEPPHDEAAALLAACSRWCDAIAHNSYLLLDECADAALADPYLELLSYEDLALVVRRDTLRLSTEANLVEALARWSLAACARARTEPTPANRRAALGHLAYCPRYLLMKGRELERALAAELLDPAERGLVCARARGALPRSACTAAQEALLWRFEEERPTYNPFVPTPLSVRTTPPPLPAPAKKKKRRCRREKAAEAAGAETPANGGCCSCFGDGLLRAFICLFD